MNSFYRTILALLAICVAFPAHAGLFSLEIVEPAANVGDIGTLHILYHGEEENLSFAVGGLDLKLSSSNAGVIKFLDAEVKNDDNRWDAAIARNITDNEIGDLFTASLFSPGLAPGSQVFAEVKYSRVGAGFTNLLVDVGGEDPLYQGDRGDVSSYVRSRGTCLGDCTIGAAPVEINLGDSWAVLKEQFYSGPVYSPPGVVTPPVVNLPPESSPLEPDEPAINFPIVEQRLAHPAQPGIFSLEIVEAATAVGDKGKLRVMYDGGPDGYSFVNGGIHLKLASSNPGLLEFSNVEVLNEDSRWAVTSVRDETTAPELFAASLLTPGLAGVGSQIFAEMEYSLLGDGAADLIMDVGGEDPLIDASWGPSWGDVSEVMFSRGVCVGNCPAGTPPVEISLGDSWAALREQMYAPPVPPTPQPTPPTDPVIDVPPVAQEPDPILPVDPELIDDPVVDIPDELPGEVPSVIEIGFMPERPWYRPINLVDWLNGVVLIDDMRYTILQIPDLQLIDVATVVDPSQFLVVDNTNFFTRNGQLHLYDTDSVNLAYDGTALAAMRLYSLGTTNASVGTLVPEPHSLLIAVLLSVGRLSLRQRGRR